MRASLRVAAIAGALGALLPSAPGARAEDAPPGVDAEGDLYSLGGLGTALNFRGVGHEFAFDATASAGPHRDAVEAARLTAEVLVLPSANRSVAWWAIWAGVRTGSFRFEKAADPTDTTPGGLMMANVEPTLGFVVAAPGDRLRFEADVAPALSISPASRLASQAALVAALSTAPHDDLLFLPNLTSGGRLRMAVLRRWDLCSRFSFGFEAEAEVGYAETNTPFGSDLGEAGGGEVDLNFYFRTRSRFLEGLIVQGDADVGYTSVWTSDIVLPARVGGRVVAAFTRTFEATLGAGAFTSSIPLGSFDSWGMTLGVRWSFDRSAPNWTQRHYDVEPQLQNLDSP